MQDNEYSHFKTLLYHEIEIKEASEPTDIIWENRQFTPFNRLKKKIIVFCIIICMLYFSFKIIFGLQKKSLSMKGRYPAQNCAEFIEEYHNRRVQWMKDSINEYQRNMEALEKTDQVFFTGPMQCFCK